MSTEFELCPDCRHANIPGADSCEQCGQSLSPQSTPNPTSALERQIVKDSIDTLSPKDAVTIESTATVGEALKTLVNKGIGCLLVTKGEQVVGIFTERDALLKINADVDKAVDRPVSEFMTPEPSSLKSTDRIAFALHRMDLGGYRHVPILDENLPSKIISIRDILQYMTDRLEKV